MDSLYGFKNFYIADTVDIYYLKRREKCKFIKKYDPQFFIELKAEVLKKEYRKFSIDAFCAVYKSNNPNKVVPSTKTVYEMIHRSQIDGIKPYMLPRLVKLKPRKKTNGHSNPKKNKKVLGNSIKKRPEHINFRKRAL